MTETHREHPYESKRILAPSILAADPLRLAEEIAALPPEVSRIHVDIMDGMYVPNMNGSPALLKALKAESERLLDVHLMVEKPERLLDLYLEAGADVLTIHQEATQHPLRWLSYIRKAGVKAGLSLNPGTSLSAAEELLPETDQLLLMSVSPGFGGQDFIPRTYARVREARKMIEEQDHDILIQVDGGVTAENAGRLWRCGVDVIVSGSAVFKAADRRASSLAILNA